MKKATVGMLLLAAGTDGVKVSSDMSTPASVKVVKMLEKLQKEVEEEADTEKKQFGEYAKFCRRGTEDKQIQIKKASTAINMLTANTDALTTEVKELETKIQATEDSIKTSQEELAKTEEDRSNEVAEYTANAKEMDSAISALDRAIATLKSSKDKITALPQLATRLIDAASKVKLLQISSSHLQMLSSIAAPGQPATYEHKSGDVISMLGGLLTTFKANKHTLEMAEGEASGSYNKKKLNINNQIKNAQAELDKQQMTKAKKKAENSEQTTELTATKQAKASDEEYLKTLTDDCTEKAEVGDQRKKSRAEEQVAIKAAVTALKEQGIGRGSFLQLGSRSQYRSPIVRHARLAIDEMKRHLHVMEANMEAAQVFQANGRSLAFLQVSKKDADPSAQSKMETLFRKVEASNNNPAVSLAIMQAKKSAASGPDAMAGVRQIIQELIDGMEKAAENDSSQRDFCLKAVAEHTENRDNFNVELEKLSNEISAGEAKKKQDSRTAAQLQKDIATATSELGEATSLRAEDKATNDANLKEAKEGKDAVDFAVTTLKNYYEKSFIQVRTSIHAGQPNVPTTEYSGSTKGKGGVLSMLKVVAEDFQRDMDRIPKEEEEAQKRFDGYKTATETDTKNKDELITSTKAAVTELESKLMELESSKQTASSSLDLTMAELDKLKGMCGSDSEKNFKDKKASRAKEIEKLEETIKVIQSMEKQMEALGQ
eukprot:TRINITY_DN1640_c0_g1_i1.p1 TRINITY_DN1640_c0_g1~~TRINITY_DN1640_c0_g1_i1.p1  ORF type:complete len:716 (-),score=242.54 TRINITY_DN1640_c0_g1_i1:141-2288(-)